MPYQHRAVDAPKRVLKRVKEALFDICRCGHYEHDHAYGTSVTRCNECPCPMFDQAKLKVERMRR